MTNTVAHTPLKRGTSARLGLRLPKPRVRVDRLILAPADVWINERQAGMQTTVEYFDTTVPQRVTPITVTNVTASRRGEPVHVSEVVAELMKTLKPNRVADAVADVALNPDLARAFGVPVSRPWPGEFLMHDMVDCCDVVHTWSADASSWLPGCTHYGAV